MTNFYDMLGWEKSATRHPEQLFLPYERCQRTPLSCWDVREPSLSCVEMSVNPKELCQHVDAFVRYDPGAA